MNIAIPDDARELDRDVLAYHRELRARRRRALLVRLLRPVGWTGFGGRVAIVPLIALCLALSLVGGVLLSAVTMGPAAAPTINDRTAPASGPAPLPAGSIQLSGSIVPVRSLVSSAIALVPAGCGCGRDLQRLAGQATRAGVGLYFVGTGAAFPRVQALTAQYGGGIARAAADPDGVLDAAYHPDGLTVLLVFRDATAEVRRDLAPAFQLQPTLGRLSQPGSGQPGAPPAGQPTTA